MGWGREMIEPFLRNRRGYYDTIFVSRPHNMQVLAPVLTGNPDWFQNIEIIYDAEALFATREVTQRELEGTPLQAEEVDQIIREEVELTTLADHIISVSEHEAALFRKHGISEVQILGHQISPSPTPRTFEERRGFLFVGAIHEESSPNGD